MVDRFERFSFAITEITRYWRKIAADEMEKYGLKGTHATCLTIMRRYPQGITAAKLCELCGKDKAEVSRMIAIMEEKGMLVRQTENQNLYRAPLILTEKGQQAAEHVTERAKVAVELAGKGIDEQDRTIFYDTLELITQNLAMISKKGLPEKVIRE